MNVLYAMSPIMPRGMKVILAGLLPLLAGCGPSAAQRWFDLPYEEQQRRLLENFERGETHVAPVQGDLKPVTTLPQGEPFRAFGEVRFKDPKATFLGAIIVQIFRLKNDGKETFRDQTTDCNLEEVQPGFFRFTAFFGLLAERGCHTVRIEGISGPVAEDTFQVKSSKSARVGVSSAGDVQGQARR